jgi:GTPase SAR1 family protein
MIRDKVKRFRNEVKEAIKDFDREQMVRFAFVCGVRALPIIGYRSNFNFWKEEKRQVYLYALFYALDCSYALSKRNSNRNDATVDYAAINYATTDRNGVTGAVTAAYAVATATNAAIAYAIAYATEAAAAVAEAAATVAYATEGATAVADAAAYAYAAIDAYAAAHAHAIISNYDIKKIIQDDIITIGANKRIEHVNIAVYGNVWDYFLRALKECDCDYWANLYQELFRNHFEFDIKELNRRLAIWNRYHNYGAAAAGNHLQSTMDASKVRIEKEARVILIGKAGAGKTSLSRKLEKIRAKLPGPRDETHGVDVKVLSWGKNKKIKTHIWDFGGQAVIYSAHRCFLANRCVYIIVCDGRTEGTSEPVIAKDFENIRCYGRESKVFVVVNKYSDHKVNFNEKFFLDQYGDIYDGKYYEIDIQKDKEAILAFKADLEAFISENPTWGDEINEKFYEVQEELKKRFHNGQDFIPVKDIQKIAEKVGIGISEFDTLLTELHIIGSGFHYDNLQEFKTVVLNPGWISHGVYTVIRWLFDNEKKILIDADFEQIFERDRKRYPKDKDHFIFQLMLEYKLGCSKEEGKMIVPCTLDAVSEKDQTIAKPQECLSFQVSRNVPLPDNFMPQLITCLYTDIMSEKGKTEVWKNSFLYVDEDVHVLAFMDSRLCNSIEISIWGKKDEFYLGKVTQIFLEVCRSCNCFFNDKETKIKYGEDYNSLSNMKGLVADQVLRSKEAVSIYYPLFNITYNVQGGGNIFNSPGTIQNAFYMQYTQAVQELLPQLCTLADELAKNSEGQAYTEFKKVIDVLDQNKECKSEEEAEKNGVFKIICDFLNQLGDSKTTLSKTVTGLEKAGKIGKVAFNLGRKAATFLIPALTEAGKLLLQ